MADKKNAFLLYKDQWDAISDLNDKTLGQLTRAIFEYQIEGKEPEKHDIIYRDFKHIKTTFDRDDAKYQDTVGRRREAGAAGGKQRVANQANASFAKNSKQDVANQADNDSVNDNDNDISFTPVTAVAEPVKQKKSRKSKSLPSRAEVEAFYELEKSNSLKDPLPPGLVAAAAARRPVVTIDALAAAYNDLVVYMTASSDMWPQGMWRCVLTKPDQLEFVQYCKLVLERGMTRAEIKSYLDQWENKGYDNNNLYATIVAWRNREATNPQKPFGGNGQQTTTVASVPKRGPKGD